MSSLCGPTIAGKPALERLDDFRGVVHRQRGLRHISQFIGIARLEFLHVRHGFDQADAAGRQLTDGADHLRVAGVADQHDFALAAMMDLDLAMNFRHQRTGGVEGEQIALHRLGRHAARHAMRREDHRRVGAGRDFAQLLDEDRALGAQALDHVAVVHDFVADIDRGAVKREQPLHRFDGAHDAGAKAERRAQQNLEGGLFRSGRHECPRKHAVFRMVHGLDMGVRHASVKLERLRHEGPVPIFRHFPIITDDPASPLRAGEA